MLRIVDQWKTDVFEHLRTALYSRRNSEDAISLFISLLWFLKPVIVSRVKREIGNLFAEMSHPLLGQRCDRGEELSGEVRSKKDTQIRSPEGE
ncbi:hypothetical protein OUZ56_017076 [Daphnia magna]|uniref:Uncharacterized protein n=1 Tax=Daphnia magna TaxID=35525 RepID=A0ABR0AS57_9CRUS|nr:hypothetical protein OUZ56_017076 [Daphnia magna]